MSDTYPAVEANITERRERLDLSINALADAAGLSRTSVKRKLAGGGDEFLTRELILLGRVLNCTAADLLAPARR